MSPTRNLYDFEQDNDFTDQLDDFDSDAFWTPQHSDHDFLDRMWGRWGSFRSRDENILVAHEMVRGFVNAFARDGYYSVVFDQDIETAGTDMNRKVVVITPAPILDEKISAQDAGRILTGMATHEISHSRFGKDTNWAVRRAFKGSFAANILGNLLDDVRIERRFVENYPGYSGVFEPTLDYIGSGMVSENNGKPVRPSMKNQLNLAIVAIRYSNRADWTGLEHERDWWQGWAERWGSEDAPRRVVAAIREALEHIVAAKVEIEIRAKMDQRTQGPTQSGQNGRPKGDQDEDMPARDAASDGSGDGESEDKKIDAAAAGQSSAASHESDGDDDEGDLSDESLAEQSLDDVLDKIANEVGQLTDEELGNAADVDAQRPGVPICAGATAVDRAAVENGVDRDEIEHERGQAQRAVKEAEFLEEDGHGRRVDVARSMRQLIRKQYKNRFNTGFHKSEIAAKYIRDAILQSRTGHTEVSHYKQRGRLDQHALHRVAQRDYRLFDRKTAPSPGRFIIWMMLDRSGSMDGYDSIQQAQVATAIADALTHVKTVRAAVWAWSNSFRGNRAAAGVALAWQTGQPTSEIAKTIDLPSAGTPDSPVLAWATRAIRKEAHVGERPVIIFCSDGWGYGDLGTMVAEARAMGVEVVSVALGGNVSEEIQRARFGKNGYVTWQGDIVKTARPLARMIARLVGRDQRR